MDLHEGCGRVKLMHMTALADPATLQAMVELRPDRVDEDVFLTSTAPARGGETSASASCRFCGSPAGNVPLLHDAPFDVCDDAECRVSSSRWTPRRFLILCCVQLGRWA